MNEKCVLKYGKLHSNSSYFMVLIVNVKTFVLCCVFAKSKIIDCHYSNNYTIKRKDREKMLRNLERGCRNSISDENGLERV